MIYTVKNSRPAFEAKREFTTYEDALEYYKSECANVGGPVIMCRWDDSGNLDAVLHEDRG